MSDLSRLNELAASAARGRLGFDLVHRVLMRPVSGSEGEDALLVTLVVGPESAGRITGDQALDLITDIQQAFDRAGDGRFPIIEYATEQDLTAAESDVSTEEPGWGEDDE